MDILSLDIYTNADIFGASTRSVKRFLDKGGILVWGIVPTGMETFETENLDLLTFRLKTVWKALDKMEKEGFLACRACTVRHKQRKYYRITSKGRDLLERMRCKISELYEEVIHCP